MAGCSVRIFLTRSFAIENLIKLKINIHINIAAATVSRYYKNQMRANFLILLRL